MTPFPDEDDEKWSALLGMGQLSAPALSDPSMQPQAMPRQQAIPEPQEDPWQALADGLPTPPTMQTERNAGGLILAMFADALLNKGRSLGSLTAAATAPKPNADMQNYQMQRQHALDKAQIAERMQRGQKDPRALALQERALELQSRGLDLEQGRLDATAGGRGETPADKLAREKWEYEKANPKPDFTPYQQESLNLQRQRMGDSAAAREDAAEARQLAQQAQADQRSATNSGKYWNDTEYYRSGAESMKRLEGTLSKYKDGDDLPAVGMVDSRIPKWALGKDGLSISSAQEWMANALQRAESGAAAPIDEALGYRIRTGSAPGATEAQFREGVAAAQQYLRGQLSSRSAGMEPEAREVLKRQGLEDWVFGQQPAPAPSRAVGPGLGVVPGQAPPMVRDVLKDDDEWEDIQ